MIQLFEDLKGAVSEMLTVVCGEAVPSEDCANAANVFVSVTDRHMDPLKDKYKKLLERHRSFYFLS